MKEENGYLTYGRMEPSYRELYSKEPLIDYKAKGENMLNTECKQCHKKWHHDNAKYCSMCGKKLVDEPEFKVGDYVTFDGANIAVSKIDRISGSYLHGLWYGPKVKKIKQDHFLSGGTLIRHATPEEIAEYEAALSFHEHGRKPFEVKKGDLIRTPSEKITLIWYPENFSKEEFLARGWEFLKTAEEVDEWLGADDE